MGTFLNRLVVLVLVWGISACGGPTKQGTPVQSDLGAKDTASSDIYSVDPKLLEGPCPEGSFKCIGLEYLALCNDDLTAFDLVPCINDKVCDPEEGTCLPVVCTPGEHTGVCPTKNSKEICNELGTNLIEEPCTAEAPVCGDGLCKFQCVPGDEVCQGFKTVAKCNPTGTQYVVDVEAGIGDECAENEICHEAECFLACAADLKYSTYLGCEFWAADLDNVEGGMEEPMAIVVSNPNVEEEAEIRIYNQATNQELVLDEPMVPPLSQRTFELPSGFDLDGSSLNRNSFYLRSDAPVVAYQFNPLNADDVYTNDASLLIPSTAAGKEFYVMSWPQRPPEHDFLIPVRGFVTIIAISNRETTVTITPSTSILSVPGLLPFTQGEPSVITLLQGEVLNLETDVSPFGGVPDLTGTHIVADRKLSVFSGHECANVPLNLVDGKFIGANYCDHLEQQLFPYETWDNEYAADAFYPRATGQSDVWRILAGDRDVIVTTDPPQQGAQEALVYKGKILEFESTESFMVYANGPISVGHFLKSSNYDGFMPFDDCKVPINALDLGLGYKETGIGDPAFTLSVPTSQYRKDYMVLTPENYQEQYLNLIYPQGTLIYLNGEALSMPQYSIGQSNWNLYTLPVEPGSHLISASEPVGVTAYGYDCDVSYAYPGGLDLTPVKKDWVEPTP